MLTKSKIGNRIKRLRTENRLTQALLKDQLGISGSALSQIETGETMPSVETLAKLVIVLKTSFNWILYGTEGSSETSSTLEDSGYFFDEIEGRFVPLDEAQPLAQVYMNYLLKKVVPTRKRALDIEQYLVSKKWFQNALEKQAAKHSSIEKKWKSFLSLSQPIEENDPAYKKYIEALKRFNAYYTQRLLWLHDGLFQELQRTENVLPDAGKEEETLEGILKSLSK